MDRPPWTALAQRGTDRHCSRGWVSWGHLRPPHLGHLACAEEALEAFGLDAVLFVPTGRPAFKQDRLVTAGEGAAGHGGRRRGCATPPSP
ncbi:MAG: hypothetical protein ACLTDR_07485 [Adlercreutzia equolifaciens]